MTAVICCPHCRRLQVVTDDAGSATACRHCGRPLRDAESQVGRPPIDGPRRPRPASVGPRPESATVAGPPPPAGYAPVPVQPVVLGAPRPWLGRLALMALAIAAAAVVAVTAPDAARWPGIILLVAVPVAVGAAAASVSPRRYAAPVEVCLLAGVIALAALEVGFVALAVLDRARGHEILMAGLYHLPGAALLGVLAALTAGYTAQVIRLVPRFRLAHRPVAAAAAGPIPPAS